MTASEVDWREVSDPVKRRKLQNRINQRASRQRRAQVVHNDGGLVIKQWSVKVNESSKPSNASIHTTRDDRSPYNAHVQPLIILSKPNSEDQSSLGDGSEGSEREGSKSSPYHPLPAMGQEAIVFLSAEHRKSCLSRPKRHLPSPADHRLLTLIYYNVFRGLHWNIDILGLDLNKMSLDDYPSPFVPLSPTATSRITRLPPTLRPTTLQKDMAHHASIDIFPCPMIRDKVLERGLTDQEDLELCHDLLGLSEDTNDWLVFHADEGPRTGVTLWGDPWDISNWEVSEYMALKWRWIFTSATELLESTNARRRARGWKEITLV